MNVTRLYRLLARLANTPFHPQWLANREHIKSKSGLVRFHHCSVLDIGSGNSDINAFLPADNRVVRLDYPSTSSNYVLTPDIYGDGRMLPFRDDCFDVVLLFEVLEHVDAPAMALSEIHRVLKRDGLLLLSVPFSYPLHDAPFDFWRFSKYGLNHLLAEKDFACAVIRETGNPFIALVQLINLVWLLAVKETEKRSHLLSLLLAFIAYPLCILNNIIALPLLLIRWRGPFTLGYHVEAAALKSGSNET